jgi:KDPG and KHG aldolase
MIAVVTAPAGDPLVETARALALGGIDLLAVPAAAPDAANVIADLADDPTIVVGVTDVVSVDQIALAVASGARFVICPACERDILSMCRANGLAVVAGGATPAELYRASSLGPDLITVFPAAMLGGRVSALARAHLSGTSNRRGRWHRRRQRTELPRSGRARSDRRPRPFPRHDRGRQRAHRDHARSRSRRGVRVDIRRPSLATLNA